MFVICHSERSAVAAAVGATAVAELAQRQLVGNYLHCGQYSVIMSDTTNGQSDEERARVVINCRFAFICGGNEHHKF